MILSSFWTASRSENLRLLHELVIYVDQLNPFSLHKDIDLRQEHEDETVERIMAFLALLKFTSRSQPNLMDVKASLLMGNDDMFVEICDFLLDNEEALKQRSYLAPFLTPLNVPPEFQQDASVAKNLNQYKTSQQNFIGIHKEYLGTRKAYQEVVDIKRQLKQCEDDKISLEQRKLKAKEKAEKLGDYGRLIDIVRRLKHEQAVASDLADKQYADKNEANAIEIKIQEAQLKLRDLQNIRQLRPEEILQKTQEDVQVLRQVAESKTGVEINMKQIELQNLIKVSREPSISQNDLFSLENELYRYQDAIRAAEERRSERTNANQDDSIKVYQQQADSISSKKQAAMKKLSKLMTEHETLISRMNGTGTGKRLTGDANSMRERVKSSQDEAMEKKRQLNGLSVEKSILIHTVDTLSKELKDLDSKYGSNLKAFRSASQMTPQQLERQIKDLKEDIASFQKKIHEKKTLMAPSVNEIRDLRQQIQHIEMTHADKKKTFDAALMGLETENLSMTQDVDSLRQELLRLESQETMSVHLIAVIEVQLEKIEKEAKYQAGTDDTLQKTQGVPSYKELYNKKIAEAENNQRTLREQQRKLKVCFRSEIF